MQTAPWLLRDELPLRSAFVGGLRLRWWMASDGLLDAALDWLKLEKHPDKTFMRKAERGFDFLGCHFRQKPNRGVIVSLAQKTISNFRNRLADLTNNAVKAERRRQAARLIWKRVQEADADPTNNQSPLYKQDSQDWPPKPVRTVWETINTYTSRRFGWATGGLGHVPICWNKDVIGRSGIFCG